MNILMEGKPNKTKIEYKYCGVWYKPWTWFKWKKILIIEEFVLHSAPFVEPNKNGDVFDKGCFTKSINEYKKQTDK